MMRFMVALSLASMLGATAASAEERCLAGEYRPAEGIAEDMRPYLVCGLLRERDGHFTVRLNGQGVSMRGGPADSCDRIRQSAVEASVARLATTIPDASARRSFVSAEFDKADQFFRVAARSDDLAVGEEPGAPHCRSSDASD